MEDQGRDLMKEKKILEREKTHLVAKAEKLSKLLADAEAD